MLKPFTKLTLLPPAISSYLPKPIAAGGGGGGILLFGAPGARGGGGGNPGAAGGRPFYYYAYCKSGNSISYYLSNSISLRVNGV